MIGGARLVYIAAVSWPVVITADVERSRQVQQQPRQQEQSLAVIVPAYRGDLHRAVSSLERWPTICSLVTQTNVDIVLYYAEGGEDADDVNEASETIAQTAGRCFFRTRTVYANLDEQDDFYPKGPSVQFYKMFLDEDVRSQLAEYDALAIVEWDVLVADDSSFEELYRAAFSGGDDFWVKGSNVGGTSFHSTAEVQEMWHVLGHINGNAIYNNNDAAFVEYVEYTRARWEYEYPYDVALWLTISDFPYSWPLWQRYSGKFVTTNLISYVGAEHVDRSSVSDAVAGHTLFIHGSRVDDGNIASRKAASEQAAKRGTNKFSTASNRKRSRQRKRKQRRLRSPETDEDEGEFLGKGCTSACGSSEGGDDATGLPEGTSTICDDSCAGSQARFDGFLCGAGDADKYGAMCRLCFTDVEEAHGVQRVLAENSNGTVDERVIMCDTMKPPEDVGCSPECHSKSYTVCDSSCGSGRYGDYDCNWRDMGERCRFCFDDMDAAFAADEIARREGGRVIMCSTMEPPLPPPEAEGNELVPEAVSRVDQSRRMQAWRENEKWKTIEKWKIIEKYKIVEKFKELRKWEYTLVLPDIPDVCTEDYCPHISGDGETGRICDENCASGIYGTLGCGTRDGIYGFSCRLCYTDQDAALVADDFANNERAIMCATALPVDIYASRRLTSAEPESAASIGRKLKGKKERSDDIAAVAVSTIPDNVPENIPENSANKGENDSELAELFADLSHRRFVEGVTRGEMCAFLAGREEEVDRWQVTVSSILQFLPGMRVAVAVEGDPKVYQRAIGNFPGVVVRDTPDAYLASLYADRFCGPGTSLIYYAEADSVISRTFTSKDTHSPNGDLLVVYSEPRSRRAHALSSLTTAVLGFQSPSFTQGVDLLLPVGANAALREKVLSTLEGGDEMGEAAVALREMADVDDIDAIPQMMAALQFSKKTSGLWFLNPQKWVAEHLFKPVSIWEIPLVKPRFGCTLPASTPLINSPAEELQRSLEFFSHGGKCENGLIAVEGGR